MHKPTLDRRHGDGGLILVEGFEQGRKNVVALVGTSMSDEQEELILETLGPEGKLTLMLDPDEAGREAEKEILSRLIDKLFLLQPLNRTLTGSQSDLSIIFL